ncbi:DUF4157 domain-containing protein [Cohnella sp. CBP 2801]|uniref:DUF4157 domain-containing protein n=2 Tax=Cohnella zeiphila TaxID=2761120 RepID=A0A7X0ST39_9BACL|nr:DUF4157 domain-containing protein [Cohnella zeiphila]
MAAATGNQALLQRMRSSEADEPEEAPLQRKSPGSNQLPAEVQAKMESAFGADFSDVKIHANSSAANNVGALAYAQGNEIHFAPGQYNPHSQRGQQMIGHELTHVIQQKAGRVAPTGRVGSGALLNDDPGLEREADEMGARAAAFGTPGPETVQRMVDRTRATPLVRGPSTELIQRMPSSQDIIAKVGAPKKHVKNKMASTRVGKFLKMKENLIENSTRYRSVLDKVDQFDQYVDGTVLADEPDGMEAQAEHVMSLYASVENAADQYIADKGGDEKTAYMQSLRRSLPMEKIAVRSTVEEHKRHPDLPKPKWKLITSANPIKMVDLDAGMATGVSDKGALNSVSFFENEIGDEGVFKETKNTILTEDEMPDTATKEERSKAGDEAWVAGEKAGIDLKNARLAERNVAMSRLDQLLGAGVIAHTEFALHNSGSGVQKGTFMLKAKGRKGGDLINGGQIVKDAEAKEQDDAPRNAIDMNDPNLQRSLSRLQLIDTLAMQIDRHFGNFFIQFDQSGRVLGVTGIDNDMSFGNVKGIAKGRQEFPGLSRFVDKELAERIIALRDDDLVSIMEDLLSPEEIDAMLARLHSLQDHLKQDKTRLLTPDQWNEASAKGMLDEHKNHGNDNSSYYGRMKNAVNGG